MDFVGKALLLDVSTYQKKNEEGDLVRYYKYTFLVGEQEDSSSFITDPHVETYTSDRCLLCGDEKVFDQIEVKLCVTHFYQKLAGQFQRVEKLQYVVVDKVGV